jgi:hypothetical protein
MIDADELLTANLLPSIRGMVEGMTPGNVLAVPQVPMWRTFLTRRSDDCWWTRAHQSLVFCDTGEAWWGPDGRGYHHHARVPKGMQPDTQVKVWGGVMHFQWADWDRLVWKHRWYKMHEVLDYDGWKARTRIDEQYSNAPGEPDAPTELVPEEWLFPAYREWWPPVVKKSWHEDQCRAWLERYGAERFAGLNLWGWPK